MARVNIDDLQTGMVLAGDVLGKNGRLLLAGGTVLEPRHLRVLRIWGASEVAVAEAVSGPAAALSPAGLEGEGDRYAAARAFLEPRFAIADRTQPAMAALFDACLRELAESEACLLPPTPPEASGAAALPPDAPADVPADPGTLVTDDPSLASFPDIYFRLRDAIDDPRTSAGQIADIIGTDPGLAATLLRLANSPFYGLSRPIDSLARGVLLIGAGELAQLALGVSVVERFRDIPSGCLNMRQTWEHAVGCGALARILAAHIGGLPQEQLFVAGLLHDLGRLVLMRRLPRHMARAIALARERRTPLATAERAVFGYDHAAVGRTLLAHWRLPPALAVAVGGHHGGPDTALDAAIVHVADVMTVAAGFGSNGSPLVPPLAETAWTALGLEPGLVPVVLSQARRQVGDIVSSLLG